jgi:hypothetical protein
MSAQITSATLDEFSKKLEAFSASLSEAERTIFKGMLGGLSDDSLEQVTGGAGFSLGNYLQSYRALFSAPQLNASLFRGLMSW